MKKQLCSVAVAVLVAGGAWAAVPREVKLVAYAVKKGATVEEIAVKVDMSVGAAGPAVHRWALPFALPTEAELNAISDAEALVLQRVAPADRTQGEAGVWREKTAAEKLVTTNAGKPAARKKAENRYFALVKDILQAAKDPRASVTPVPKLTLEEIDDVLDSVANEQVASKLASRLSVVVLTLDRQDKSWFDTASVHAP